MNDIGPSGCVADTPFLSKMDKDVLTLLEKRITDSKELTEAYNLRKDLCVDRACINRRCRSLLQRGFVRSEIRRGDYTMMIQFWEITYAGIEALRAQKVVQ